MFSSFRQSMTWLHTWFGLGLGYVLMVCFFFGALSVFDREIDRWAIPETRFEAQPMPSFDHVLLPLMRQIEPGEADYAAKMPRLHDPAKGPMTPRQALPVDEFWAYTTHRDPVLLIGSGHAIPHPKDPEGFEHIHGRKTIDPRSGASLNDHALKIGSGFFYPLHYSLNLKWNKLGYWIAGLAGLVMLVALVTGVIMHRKVFRELFTFRPHKSTQRSTLDLHNLTGVAALPFHFFFAFTGVLVFASWLYFPLGETLLHPLHERHEVEKARRTGLPLKAAGVPAPLASVDDMVAEAKRRWAARDMAGEVGFLKMQHVGDANSYVSIYRAGSDRVALVGEGVHFKASTGEVLGEDPPRTIVSEINEFLIGLHLQHFEHWLLRWLYVLGGLLGCICIATGFIFFVEKRKKHHARNGSQVGRVVDALAVATVTGMLLAAGSMLLANRLLPADMTGKDQWEITVFYGAWLGALLHAAWRGAPVAQGRINPAWREQCWATMGLALAAVIANAITTGDNLVRTVFTDPYWPVAGVDLSLLLVSGLAMLAARQLALKERLGVHRQGSHVKIPVLTRR